VAGGAGGRTAAASILAAFVVGAIAASGAGGAGQSTAVLLAAGDIAVCTGAPTEATAALLDANAGAVAALGDNAYEDGSATDYANCYDPTWGRAKSRTRPTPGNHDYHTAGAAGYFGYFGAAAGDPAKGYYSYELGAWHVVVLNSNCTFVSCAAGSAQELWLRADLARSTARCTLAYWHHARFSSGDHGSNAEMQPFWSDLYRSGADLVLTAHDHDYERFAPQNAAGVVDPAHGVREFVVGTGGAPLGSLGTPAPNSEVRDASTYGILRLSLRPNGYGWQFLPVAGQTFTDSGSNSCHGAPPGPPTCRVPAVIGWHLGFARNALLRARCATGRVRSAKSRRARGIVVSQSPRAGLARPIGTRVNLTVSRGRV
jgi:acid phosphatase type 7